MLFGVDGVEEAHQHRHRQHEDGVELELVGPGETGGKGGTKSKQRLGYADVGEGFHLFMGDDGGVVRRCQHVQKEDEDGALKDQVRGSHAAFGDDHFGVEEPYSQPLGQKQHRRGQNYLYEDGGGEDLLHPFLGFAELEGHEAADGSGHRAGEDAEKRDHSAHRTVDAEVVLPEGIQDHAGGVQAHDEHHGHADVQEGRVSGYPAAVLGDRVFVFHHMCALDFQIYAFFSNLRGFKTLNYGT